MIKIKICGLSRNCDIEAVNEAKPDYIGFVFAESKRQITPQAALTLREKLNSGIVPVGVFVNEEVQNIISLVKNGVIEAVQLHGDEDEEYIGRLKPLCGKPVIKAVSVTKSGDARKWKNTCADYLLLDKGVGGTGERFDWKLIEKTGKPFFLAGGINLGNIDEAVEEVNPFAVDISSGVETGGLKDYIKILEIVRRINNFNENI